MKSPLVSIVINNYNYARFLADAIESALGQSYSRVEVIVVDDGSTDDSRELILSYANRKRIIPVFKENGGQGSAFNAGFSVAKGDIVIFLDADDLLLPEAVERVVGIWKPELAKVQWRLQLVNEHLQPLEETWPLSWQKMPSGDLRKLLMRWREYPSPPTSGNAFSRQVLGRILPLPEERWKISADFYLLSLAPLFGEVVSIDEVLGYYRIHGRNNWFSNSLQGSYLISFLVKQISIGKEQEEVLRLFSRRLNLSFQGYPPPHLCKAFISLSRLEPRLLKSLMPNISILTMSFKCLYSLLCNPNFPSKFARMRLLIFFILTLISPKGIVEKVIRLGLFPNERPKWLSRILGTPGSILAEKTSRKGKLYDG